MACTSFLTDGPLQLPWPVLQNIQRWCKSSKIKINEMKGIKNRTPSRILYYQKDNNNNPRKKKKSAQSWWGPKNVFLKFTHRFGVQNVVKNCMELFKCWTLLWAILPAKQHDVIPRDKNRRRKRNLGLATRIFMFIQLFWGTQHWHK